MPSTGAGWCGRRAPTSPGPRWTARSGLLGLLGRRLPFAVPAPKGFVALEEGGRAAVYPFLPGHNLDYSELPAGPGIAAELGRAIAALHNTDPAVYEEAGLPSYDADAYRTRRLAELDRAAESGRVPTTLLTRWESALEDVTLWRFAPTATHGDLTGDQVLAVFTDDDDASTGKVRAITGWEDAKVADPADDFAALVADAPPETVETVLEAYSHTRVERPDANLLVRARLVAELGLLTTLMVALTRKDVGAVEVLTTQLRRLDDAVHPPSEEPDDYRRTSLAPVGPRRRTTQPPALVVDDDDEDLPEVADELEADPADGRRGRGGGGRPGPGPARGRHQPRARRRGGPDVAPHGDGAPDDDRARRGAPSTPRTPRPTRTTTPTEEAPPSRVRTPDADARSRSTRPTR